MKWAVAKGLIAGIKIEDANEMYLDPQGNTTRAQLAVILMRFCELLTE